jgi:hypothetical protein
MFKTDSFAYFAVGKFPLAFLQCLPFSHHNYRSNLSRSIRLVEFMGPPYLGPIGGSQASSWLAAGQLCASLTGL